MAKAALRKFLGLTTAVSPHAVPLGAARTMTNWWAPTSTYLTTRSVLVERTIATPTGLTSDVNGLFRYDGAWDERLIFQTEAGNVYDTTTQPPYETGITARSCWTQGPEAGLIRVDGAARGTIRFETTGAPNVFPLGIDAPVAPTMAPTTAGNALAGTYSCAYRYTTADGATSVLSPFASLSPTAAGTAFAWTIAWPSDAPRITGAELYRSAADDAETVYLVGTLTPSTTTLTETLADAAGAALPILTSSDLLYARRQVVPPTTCAVVVPHQGRYWYSVDSDYPRRVFFSYAEEPESVPAEQNAFDVPHDPRDPDRNTGLIPWGTAFLVTQQRATWRYGFATEPVFDLEGRTLVHRGMVNQRCWAAVGDSLFVLDQRGLWGIAPDGLVEYEQPITDLFRDRIDWAQRAAFFVSADPLRKYVRAHVMLIGGVEAGDITVSTTQVGRPDTWVQNRIDTLSSTASPTVAATVTTNTNGQAELSTIDVLLGAGNVTGGTFKLSLNYQTGDIGYSVSASDLRDALATAESCSTSAVTVTSSGTPLQDGGNMTIEWDNAVFTPPVSVMTYWPGDPDAGYSIERSQTGQPAINEVQHISLHPTPNNGGGTWTLTFAGTTTGQITTSNSGNATAVQTICNAAWGNSTVGVTGSGTTASPFVVTFGGGWAATNAPQMTANVGTLKHYLDSAESKTLTVDGTPIELAASAGSGSCFLWVAADIETAIEAELGSGTVSCSGGPIPEADITIEWTGSLAGEDGPASVSLTGTSATHMTSTNSQAGEGLTGRNAVQQIAMEASMAGGTWSITYGGQTTASLAYSASAAAVQSALIALSNIGSSDVAVVTSGASYVYAVTFQNSLGNQTIAPVTVTSGVTVAMTRPNWALVYAVDEGQFWLEQYATGLGDCVMTYVDGLPRLAFGGPDGTVLYHAAGHEDDYNGQQYPLTATFKTGLIPATAIADAGRDQPPSVEIIYEPTAASVLLKVRLYWDHDTAAVTFNAESSPSAQAQFGIGQDYCTIDLGRNASTLGAATGRASIPLRALMGHRYATEHSWFALEFELADPAEAVTLYGVEFYP